MGNVISLDAQRVRRRLNQFDDTIDRFDRMVREAAGSADAMRNARKRYVASLTNEIRKEVVGLLVSVDENLVSI